jgi:glycine cleavage system aminomethyltransferase T
VIRAVEQGITDTQYRMNSGMDPLEAGMGDLLDLDRPAFVGRDALRRVRDEGPARVTLGLAGNPGEQIPWLTDFWPLELPDGTPAGVVRWAVNSYALDRPIAIALAGREHTDAPAFVMQAPEGPVAVTPHPFPFV